MEVLRGRPSHLTTDLYLNNLYYTLSCKVLPQ